MLLRKSSAVLYLKNTYMTNTLNVEFNVFTLSSYKTFLHCSVSVKQQRNKTSGGFIWSSCLCPFCPSCSCPCSVKPCGCCSLSTTPAPRQQLWSSAPATSAPPPSSLPPDDASPGSGCTPPRGRRSVSPASSAPPPPFHSPSRLPPGGPETRQWLSFHFWITLFV